MSTKLLDLVNITKSYDGVTILDDLNLYIRENEFLTLLGPSGCGKTTTLRILGGFETPDAGKVLFNGQDITQLPPNKRQLNTVFQKYALFTHMTIAENIAFGLKIKGKSKAYINDKIKYALKLVNLEGYENRSPALLSGSAGPPACGGLCALRAQGRGPHPVGLHRVFQPVPNFHPYCTPIAPAIQPSRPVQCHLAQIKFPFSYISPKRISPPAKIPPTSPKVKFPKKILLTFASRSAKVQTTQKHRR